VGEEFIIKKERNWERNCVPDTDSREGREVVMSGETA
jgi:hypothetical protein